MEDKSNNKNDLQGPDHGICGHKMCANCKRCSAIIIKYEGIDRHMHQQKTDEEQSAQCHCKFSAQRARKSCIETLHRIIFKNIIQNPRAHSTLGSDLVYF